MKLRKTLLASVFAVISAPFFIAGNALAEMPQISDARVVQPPPGSNVAAAFFTINNPGNEPLFITDAQSGIADKVEVHLSSVVDDVAKMEKQASVEVPAGESLDFEHGSYHIMFMGLNTELQAGDDFDLVITTSEGDIDISVPVISLEEAMSGSAMEDSKGMGTDTDMKMDSDMPKDSQ